MPFLRRNLAEKSSRTSTREYKPSRCLLRRTTSAQSSTVTIILHAASRTSFMHVRETGERHGAVRGPHAPADRGRRYVHTTSETLTWALRQVPSQVHAAKMPDDSTPPHHTCFFVNLPHPHTHTPGSVSNLRGRGVRWPHHIPHTTPPPLCPVCFHHAAPLAPSSSSHSRSRRTMLKRASPALEHLEKTDHQTALSPVRDSRRGSVSCSSAWDPVLID